MKYNSFSIIFAAFLLISCQQEESYLLLGDMHYDLLENHSIEWLATTKDDLRQVTTEYTVFTKNFWKPFTEVVKRQSKGCDAVLQMGDISEGLAGTPELAYQMADSCFAAIDRIGFDIPMLIVKGNHDITGPGAREAFDSIYLPNISRLARLDSIPSTSNYAKKIGNTLFVAYDPWSGSRNSLDALEKNLTCCEAKNKVVFVHEPLIPINERCWHLVRRHEDRRQELLRIIASNHAIVLCAHMHLYSVVERDTEWGPIVQILVNSVNREPDMTQPRDIRTEYGPSLALNRPDWQPETMEQRVAWLEAEAPFVHYYKCMDLPGYGKLKIGRKGISLDYYAGLSERPYDTVNISELLDLYKK